MVDQPATTEVHGVSGDRSAMMKRMQAKPITASLVPPGPFWIFGREERNAVAILFGLLTRPGNLETFAKCLHWQPQDLAKAEVSVEWTFLRDLWNHNSNRQNNDTLRKSILDCLQPSNRAFLADCSVLEFNGHFGAVPQPSSLYIQSPGNWSLGR